MSKGGRIKPKNGKINVIIRTFIIGDIFIFLSQGIVQPIFAIFLNENIEGGSIATAGIAATVFLVTKATLQIPISRFTDHDEGNRAEAITLLGGYGLFIAVPILFLMSTTIWHIYLAEVVFGLGSALAYPGWVAIFTKFADKKREGFEWSLFSTGASLSMALAGAVGGIIGELYGFHVLFWLMTSFAIISFSIYAFFLTRYQAYIYSHD